MTSPTHAADFSVTQTAAAAASVVAVGENETRHYIYIPLVINIYFHNRTEYL